MSSLAIEDVKFTTLNNNNGLSHNTVRHITQDKCGFIWISTLNGLNRYDGNNFKVIQSQFESLSLSKNTVKKTVEDDFGHLWISSTSDIIDCYNMHTESFVDYSATGSSKEHSNIKMTSDGSVWLFGKKTGLLRMKHQEAQPSNYLETFYLQNSMVNFMYEDQQNNIWIGTNTGLFQVADHKISRCADDGTQQDFTSVVELKGVLYFFTKNHTLLIYSLKNKEFQDPIGIKSSLLDTETTDAIPLSEERILLATKKDLWLFQPDTKKIEAAHSLFKDKQISSAKFYVDNKGNQWVYNNTGVIWLYHDKNKKFIDFQLIPPSILALIDMERYAICVDSRNIAWITTYGNGLFGINLETQEITHFTTQNSDFKTNKLLSVFEDRDGSIWVGTEFTGIVRLLFPQEQGVLFAPNPKEANRDDRIVRTAFEDEENNIWLGTRSGNLYQYDQNQKLVETLHIPKGLPYAICKDDNNIWVGTKGGGLFKINQQGKKISLEAQPISTKTNSESIYAIMIDTKKRMWIGTYGGGLILGEKQVDRYQFRTFPAINKIQHKIRCIIEDHAGNIWLGGNNGLICFQAEKLIEHDSCFIHFQFNEKDSNSLSNSEIKAIYEDQNHNIWLGTSGNGINLMSRNEDGQVEFKRYSAKNGLINNVVQAIAPDKDNNIWFSTESGISKLNPSTMVFENFSWASNWASNLFCESVGHKRSNGSLMFGSYNGLHIINPSEMKSAQNKRPITITGLSINGNPIKPNGLNAPIKKSISETSSISLHHNQNTFSVDFASLNFVDYQKDRYTYILENFDDNWNPVTTYNVATYRNIPPGKYLFKVKPYNSSLETNDKETKLEIIIKPPFWKSWQAGCIYFLSFLVFSFLILRLISRMNQLNNKVKVEKQLTEYKLRFFTNISHEFRTPLTIIQASIESLKNINTSSQKLKKKINILDKSSARLLKLIDQLLEFRKLQNNQLDLNLTLVDIEPFFLEIYEQFSEIAKNKHIDYSFVYNSGKQILPIDVKKIDTVVFNLLSNAFKNTPKGGSIRLNLQVDADKICFDLSDSGPGVPPDKIDLLFERFKPINKQQTGIGIGLNLTKELVKAFGGEITYNQSNWGGASFMVNIPIVEYSISEVENTEATLHHLDIIEIEDDAIDYDDAPMDYTILIIEDDDEIRNFLKDQLKDSFSVHITPNGESGLEKACNESIDLIVCDVTLPKMDGFEFTRQLKKNFQTSHIPIILLTANSSIEKQIEGIEAGADAYITKPFSFKYLRSRIIKLIEQREKLQRKMSADLGMIKPTITTIDKDKEFIEKVNATIEQELANSNLSVEVFAQSLNMSRTLFYKKIKSLTGHPPNEYIRLIRLNKSAELLQDANLQISEVAYSVGFSDPFYFSKCFKEQFKTTPTKYRKNQGTPALDNSNPENSD